MRKMKKINGYLVVRFNDREKAFMLDAIVDEDRERLTTDMEEYPGVAITIGNKLTELLGLTDGVNLKKL